MTWVNLIYPILYRRNLVTSVSVRTFFGCTRYSDIGTPLAIIFIAHIRLRIKTDATNCDLSVLPNNRWEKFWSQENKGKANKAGYMDAYVACSWAGAVMHFDKTP